MTATTEPEPRDVMAWVRGYRINQWEAERALRAFGGNEEAARRFKDTHGWGGLWDEFKLREVTP